MITSERFEYDMIEAPVLFPEISRIRRDREDLWRASAVDVTDDFMTFRRYVRVRYRLKVMVAVPDVDW